MTKVSSLSQLSLNETVLFKNQQEIERFIELYEKEGIQPREDTIECLGHFMFSTKEINGVGVCVSSCCANHGTSDINNIHFFAKDDNITIKTIKDVNAGDELFMDYRTFDYMDDFWLEFSKKERVRDVITSLKRFVDV